MRATEGPGCNEGLAVQAAGDAVNLGRFNRFGQVSVGSTVGRRLASMVFPDPGGPPLSFIPICSYSLSYISIK